MMCYEIVVCACVCVCVHVHACLCVCHRKKVEAMHLILMQVTASLHAASWQQHKGCH